MECLLDERISVPCTQSGSSGKEKQDILERTGLPIFLTVYYLTKNCTVYKDTKLQKITEFYVEWFSIC
jgi:hypothetical protein